MPPAAPWLVLAAALVLAFAAPWLPVVALPWPGGAVAVRPITVVAVLALAALVLGVLVAVRGPREVWWRLVVDAGVGGLAALVALAVAGAGEVGTTYTVLHPTSPAGCKVLVRETSVFMAGSGEILVLDDGWGLSRSVGDYAVDDGGTPIADGSYTLTWNDDREGTLTLRGTPGREVIDGVLTGVTCR